MAGGTGAFQAGTQLPGFLLDLVAYQNAKQLVANLATPIAVATTAVVYTQSFPLRRGMTFGWEIKMSSSGVCTVTIELEQANQPPTTELAQDDAFVIPANKTGANGMFPAGTIITTNTYNVAYSPNASALGRLKITGTGSNDATTALAVARMYAIKNF